MFGAGRTFACAGIALVILASSIMVSIGVSAEDSTVAGADLTVSDIIWLDMYGAAESTVPTLTSGQPFTVMATIENTGTKDAAGFSTDLYVDGALLGSHVTADGLAAHGTLSVAWPGVIASDCAQHEATVSADSLDQVAESNPEGTAEANNEQTEVFDVVRAEWTFALYADGDNNLEYYAYLDFLEMAFVGTSPLVNLVVQVDRIPGYSNDSGNWTDAKRFLVTKGMEPLAENAYEDLGEVNMGDGAVLTDFATDTFNRFRANHTCLVLWDHGGSWYGGCCRDQTSSSDSLKTDEMRLALAEVVGSVGEKVDVIAFDACVMSAVEICYAFEGLCDDFVASEGLLAGTGWPYDDILQRLADSPMTSPDEFCEIITVEHVEEYPSSSIATMSAFRVDAVCTDVRDALSVFADSLIAGLERYETQIKAARNAVYGFDIIMVSPYMDSYSADLYSFAEEVASRVSDDSIKAAAADLMSALEDSRIAFGIHVTYKPYGDVFGLMIFWPEAPAYLEEYQLERLSMNATWDEFLLAYFGGWLG